MLQKQTYTRLEKWGEKKTKRRIKKVGKEETELI